MKPLTVDDLKVMRGCRNHLYCRRWEQQPDDDACPDIRIPIRNQASDSDFTFLLPERDVLTTSPLLRRLPLPRMVQGHFFPCVECTSGWPGKATCPAALWVALIRGGSKFNSNLTANWVNR
jgi:hypothetical protein